MKSLKRKIYQSAGLKYIEQSPKRLKTAYTDENDENLNPNIINGESLKKSEENVIEPPLNIDIQSMTVKELRKELKSFHLETKGLKKDLQIRLGEAMKNKNKNSSSKEDEGNQSTLNNENEEESSKMKISLSSKIETEHQKNENNNMTDDDDVIAMKTKSEEELMMVNNKVTSDNERNEEMQRVEDVTINGTTSQNKASFDVNMEKCSDQVVISESTPSLVIDCEAAPSCNRSESNDLNSTSKNLEKSIDGFKKLSVDSDNRHVVNVGHHMIDGSKEVVAKNKNSEEKKKTKLSGYRSASPKPGRVQKFMKATSKLFSPSKKRDTTPSKPPTPSMTSKPTLKPPKIVGKEVIFSEVIVNSSPKVEDFNKSVSVSEIAKKFETGIVQKAKSDTE